MIQEASSATSGPPGGARTRGSVPAAARRGEPCRSATPATRRGERPLRGLPRPLQGEARVLGDLGRAHYALAPAFARARMVVRRARHLAAMCQNHALSADCSPCLVSRGKKGGPRREAGGGLRCSPTPSTRVASLAVMGYTNPGRSRTGCTSQPAHRRAAPHPRCSASSASSAAMTCRPIWRRGRPDSGGIRGIPSAVGPLGASSYERDVAVRARPVPCPTDARPVQGSHSGGPVPGRLAWRGRRPSPPYPP
ncbi:hypothetical protein LV779_19290 [Streptomyces thinghirensis]|nr:hypothetical protein [Streptomyces thinghirensis]